VLELPQAARDIAITAAVAIAINFLISFPPIIC